MYICDFSRSVGAGSATTRNTRGLTRSVIRLIVPPFPAVSRPSNTTQILAPVDLTHSCMATRAKICVVFEGRDTAGKGGTIKRITERVSPRVFRVVALAAPTPREKSQMYIQRYVEHFPAGGEVIIFDRSWYNRAGVERVMGFCAPEQTDRFL